MSTHTVPKYAHHASKAQLRQKKQHKQQKGRIRCRISASNLKNGEEKPWRDEIKPLDVGIKPGGEH
jgi:hypothetical protein